MKPWSRHKELVTLSFISVQLFSRVQLLATPCTVARQASLSITNSQSLLKLMSIELVIPLNHLILCLCHPLLLLPSIFPSIRVFSNESVLCIRWPKSIGVSASASVLPMNIQDWFLLGLTGCISLLSKGLSRVFSNNTVQKHQFSVLSFLYGPTLISTHDYWKSHSFNELLTFVIKVMSLLFNMLSRLVIAFLPRRNLLILWLQSLSSVIL